MYSETFYYKFTLSAVGFRNSCCKLWYWIIVLAQYLLNTTWFCTCTLRCWWTTWRSQSSWFVIQSIFYEYGKLAHLFLKSFCCKHKFFYDSNRQLQWCKIQQFNPRKLHGLTASTIVLQYRTSNIYMCTSFITSVQVKEFVWISKTIHIFSNILIEQSVTWTSPTVL